MSKELEAFRIMVKDNGLELPYHNTIIAIETALKDYERLKETLITAKRSPVEINKEHKALEIIKEKNVSIHWLKDCKDRVEYNDLVSKPRRLTQTEFDLLKEVFL